MVHNLFVYLIDPNSLRNVSASLGNLEMAISLKKPFFLLPANQLKEKLENDDIPEAIMVFHQVSFETLSENLEQIACHYELIFLGWHLGGNISPELFQNHRLSAKIREKKGSHTSNNPVYLSAGAFIKGKGDAYLKAYRLFAGFPYLDALIHLAKRLEVFFSKNLPWDEKTFEAEMMEIEKDPEVNIVLKRSQKIAFCESKSQFRLTLDSLAKEIEELSLNAKTK